MKNEEIYDYDYIFITDLPLGEEELRLLADKKFKGKVFVFDHHKSSIGEYLEKYPFATIKIQDDKGLCSGTSLFYYFLLEQNLLLPTTKTSDFVELTRRYDTWEWKTKYNDETAHELTLLFDSVGIEGYLSLLASDLTNNSQENFAFNELEKMLIENKKNQVQSKLKQYTNQIIVKEILGKRAGIIFIDYEYRNDIAEYLRQINYDIDFVMLITMDKGAVSLRSIKDDVEVRTIAEYFGGKGHDKAASFPILVSTQEEIIEKIIVKK